MDGHIVELKKENFHRCLDIWEMVPESRTALAETFYSQLLAGRRRTFVYAMKGDYIAEISLVSETSEADYTIPGQRAYVSHLVVRTQYRRQGLGRQLVDFICALAVQAGYQELTVGVDLDNFAAIRLYSNAGFNRIIKVETDAQGAYVKLLKRL